MTMTQTPPENTSAGYSPDLVFLGIEAGKLDTCIQAVIDAAIDRRDLVESRKAASLNKGDRFLVQRCSPKKWIGATVTFVKREGMWLVCEVDDLDARRLMNIGMHIDPIPSVLKITKFRDCHVGTIFRKES